MDRSRALHDTLCRFAFIKNTQPTFLPTGRIIYHVEVVVCPECVEYSKALLPESHDGEPIDYKFVSRDVVQAEQRKVYEIDPGVLDTNGLRSYLQHRLESISLQTVHDVCCLYYESASFCCIPYRRVSQEKQKEISISSLPMNNVTVVMEPDVVTVHATKSNTLSGSFVVSPSIRFFIQKSCRNLKIVLDGEPVKCSCDYPLPMPLHNATPRPDEEYFSRTPTPYQTPHASQALSKSEVVG